MKITDITEDLICERITYKDVADIDIDKIDETISLYEFSINRYETIISELTQKCVKLNTKSVKKVDSNGFKKLYKRYTRYAE